jgi:hypothetical protein
VAAVVVIGAARAAAGVPPTHDFLLNCAGCHRFDGSGSERVPSLYDVGRIVSMPGGREYLARVPGVAQAPIDDERLAALLNWLLRRFGDTVAAPTYGAAEVGRLRRRPFTDPGAARTALFESARTAPFESARPAP